VGFSKQDRCTRIGWFVVRTVCAEHGTHLLVLNQEQHSPEREMVLDNRALLFYSALLLGSVACAITARSSMRHCRGTFANGQRRTVLGT
jgi:hypothetical protein